jgi:HEAT repeat protein
MQLARRQHRKEREQILQEKEERQREERLQRLLVDLDEPENHDLALFQINQLGVAAIEALIDTLLNNQDPDARYGSARALGQICNEHGVKGLIRARATKALIRALADREPAVRYWSSDALGKCQSQIAVEPLIALLDDPHEGVRRRVREALQQICGEDFEEIVAAANRPTGILGWIKGG